jgi:hypothetical protein
MPRYTKEQRDKVTAAVDAECKRLMEEVDADVERELRSDAREVQRLTQIIIDAQRALDHLDGVIALETWDDDEIPAAVRGAALAVRFRLERLHPDFHRDEPLPPRHG